MRKTYTLRVNADGSFTVKVGRDVESFGLLGKDKREIFERTKMMLQSKGAFISDERLTEDLHGLIWQHISA